MTSIVAWVGVDQRKPASLYIASDSRITWDERDRWDHGRKSLASALRPHIFGYWSDVLFPALALPTVIQHIDDEFLSEDRGDMGQAAYERIRALWATYPHAHRRSFGILHGFRTGEGMACEFKLTVTFFDATTEKWSFEPIANPNTSAFLQIKGSGGSSVRQAQSHWEASDAAGTSRAAFSAFTDALRAAKDPLSGGGPQLVGLYRKGPARTFGTVFGGKRYFAGALVARDDLWNDTAEWRNELFERVDGAASKRLDGTQLHALVRPGARRTLADRSTTTDGG